MDAIGVSAGGRFLPATAQADYASAQIVAVGSGVTQTTAFAALNTVVILRSNVACWYSVGATAAAHVAGSDYLPANTAWMVKIAQGATLAFIQDTVGGWVAVTPMLQPNPATAGPPLLLDNVPGATAAYSLRRLRNGYPGPAVTIRRSSDNTLQNIGFVGNDFDVGSFSAFVGGGTGFVATWYDQSGNGSNATAIGGLTANQSPVVLAVTPSGKAAVNSTATSQGMIAATAASPAVVSLAAVSNRTGNQTNHNVYLSFDGGCPGLDYVNSANGGIVVGNVGVVITTAAVVTDNAFHSAIGIVNGAATQVTTETGATGTNTITGATGATQIDLIGRASFGFIGYLAEGIIWSRALAAGESTQVFSDQRAYYGF